RAPGVLEQEGIRAVAVFRLRQAAEAARPVSVDWTRGEEPFVLPESLADAPARDAREGRDGRDGKTGDSVALGVISDRSGQRAVEVTRFDGATETALQHCGRLPEGRIDRTGGRDRVDCSHRPLEHELVPVAAARD